MEGYFYTITREGVRDNAVEELLAAAEAVAAPIVAAWITDAARPTDSEIREMVSFVALLETRGPRSIAAVREMTVAFGIEQLKELGRNPDRLRQYLAEMREQEGLALPEAEVLDGLAHFDERFRLNVDDEYAMAQGIRLTETKAAELGKMNWALCNAEGAFFTSDTPVCTFLPFPNGKAIFGGGFGQPQVEVTLPLSPSVCLLISRRTTQRRLRISEARVREYSRRAAHIAERFIISPVKTRRFEAVASEARRTLDLPKIDRAEFAALARQGLRLFPPR